MHNDYLKLFQTTLGHLLNHELG